ncbi:MAG: hypothetical protein PHU24_05980 [Sphaerochaetaceae bacterium]|jgi:hypothetical protein|nr:hypothetical protein [Sphaerochaetaceae bacterium]NLO60672.1 hypothetical protein [Spirochaetales bacterium]MDD2405984.1 hypothetical protein [Sphaerochaetaceae bacterium]MDD4259499.1 hypothetical protein [Sphaerochaetaceae bacterium]MDD4763190.1 hypothetical protein [Sphaerochaetaceae bacterium]
MNITREMFEQLPDDACDADIESTAVSLERHPYTPLMILEFPGFLRCKRHDMVAEFDRLVKLPMDAPELKAVVSEAPRNVIEKQLGLLLYHYKLLCRLRSSDAEAWDVVHELYEDD